MSERPATRMSLLAARAERTQALAGVAVLREKRDALLREVLDSANELIRQWPELTAAVQAAANALVTVSSIDGRAATDSAGLGSVRQVQLEVEERSIWGVRVPEVRKTSLRRGLLDRGLSPTATNARLDHAAELFENVLDQVLDSAPTQIKISRLGGELRRTNRRINTLEQQLIVQLDREVARIEQRLDEREREERYRLKRVKARTRKASSAPPASQREE